MSSTREALLHSLIERMRLVMKDVHGCQGFRFGDCLVSPPQAHILFCVAGRKEGVSVKELAEALKVTPGAVTQFVDALVGKGLLRRYEDEDDRRILRIKRTPLAESRFQQFREDYFAAVARVFGALSDDDLRQLTDLLGKVTASSEDEQSCGRAYERNSSSRR